MYSLFIITFKKYSLIKIVQSSKDSRKMNQNMSKYFFFNP